MTYETFTYALDCIDVTTDTAGMINYLTPIVARTSDGKEFKITGITAGQDANGQLAVIITTETR